MKHGFSLIRTPVFQGQTAIRDFVPSDLGASLLAYWNADRSDLITLNTNKVTSWKDTVNAYDAVQGTDAARPTYANKSLTFDGTDDYLELASQPFPTEHEIWTVFKQDATSGDGVTRILFSMGVSTNGRYIARTTINQFHQIVGNGTTWPTTTVTSPTITTRHLGRSRVTGSAEFLSVDGNAEVTQAVTPAAPTTRVRIGVSSSSLAGFWTGKVRDIIVTNALNSVQANQLQTYLLKRKVF